MKYFSHNYIEIGKHIINIEITGLKKLYTSLGSEFSEAIRTILNCSGYVIVTGMGKSGHIGKKISSTMSSTGTPAYFIHPAEASHGDLGLIRSRDALLAISNSGETRELADILLFSKQRKIPIIAITGNRTSTLGKMADIVLELPSAQEACPLERAPTTSTTATLALGDALAMTLMKIRGFTEVDFANFHPGGKLGATLLTAGELLKKHNNVQLPLVDESAEMSEIVLTITRGLRGHAGVIDGNGYLVGIISDGDLRRAYASQDTGQNAAAIMSRTPKTVDISMRAYEVRELMKANRISAVFVVDSDNRPIGLLHLQELLRL